MSVIRRFSELFIPTSNSILSLHARVLIPISIASVALVSTLHPFQDRGILFTFYGFALVVIFMYIAKILEKALRTLALPLMFIALGLFIHVLSMILGLSTPPIYYIVLSSFKLSLVFMSIALFFQWLKFREFRCVLKRVGLGRLVEILTIVMAVMPILFNNYAESYTAVVLKLGKRRAYKAVKPLVVQSAILAMDVAQALYLYGFPRGACVHKDRTRASEIVLAVTIVVGGLLLLIYMP